MAITNDDVKPLKQLAMAANSGLTVQNLYALSKATNKTMTLTLPDSRQFTVIFNQCGTPRPIGRGFFRTSQAFASL